MRNGFSFSLSVLAAALLSATANAATVIEMESGPARIKSVMTVENGKARLQSELANYSLIDPGAGQYLYVSQERKQVVKMSDSPPVDLDRRVSVPTSNKTKLVRKGAGPKIAGYSTQLYQLFTNGALCLNTYLSREAMMRGQLKEFHSAFYRMQKKQKQDAQAAGAEISPCDDAQEVLMARYPELGLAMRTVDPNGQVRQEVVSIKTDVVVDNNYFQAPLGFKQLTHEAFLRQMEGTVNIPLQPAPAVNKGGNN
ncbi:MAG: hypothetical protein HYS18_12035 [Burkholderiales bacterium]|nr:hypothetical protein [Burkholderiales bacterium]